MSKLKEHHSLSISIVSQCERHHCVQLELVSRHSWCQSQLVSGPSGEPGGAAEKGQWSLSLSAHLEPLFAARAQKKS